MPLQSLLHAASPPLQRRRWGPSPSPVPPLASPSPAPPLGPLPLSNAAAAAALSLFSAAAALALSSSPTPSPQPPPPSVPQAQGWPAVLDMADASAGQPQGESTSEQQHYDPAKDTKRKTKSKDPAWKYCYWPDLNKKDVVKCILCDKIVHTSVRRLKQRLISGHGDVAKCPKTTSAISKEMHEYLKKNARQKPLDLDDDKER
jgi:hypothetical protein